MKSLVLQSLNILNESLNESKCIAWMHCKSLWIKASAKCINGKCDVNEYLNESLNILNIIWIIEWKFEYIEWKFEYIEYKF